MKVKRDCRFYNGYAPCTFNKTEKAVCSGCQHYDRLKKRILIIKLGALGDVIRSTPLLRKLREAFPGSEISWVSNFPEILAGVRIDNILKVDEVDLLWLRANEFDWLINLDKDKAAISLAKTIKAKKKSGFTMDRFGKCKPIGNGAARHKWLTGIDDELSRKNSKSYLEEIFAICGFDFKGEEYIVADGFKTDKSWKIDYKKRAIGLNTGSGSLWKTRQWPERHWVDLAERLKREGYEPILLGGEAEHDKNTRIAKMSGAKYFGHFGLKEFIDLLNQCELLVTCVTMCLHLGLGLKKKVVLLNSTFNRNEFFMYSRGEILEPDIDCDCYYAVECPRQCMEHLSVDKVFEVVKRI